MSRSEGIRQMIASAQLDRIWPHIFSIVIGALSWSLVWGSQILLLPDGISDQMVVLTGLLMIVDVFLGLIALLLLPFRRRAPLTIATVVTISLVISASATGAAMVAVVHMAARVSRSHIVFAGIVWMLAGFGNGAVFLPAPGITASTGDILGAGAVAILLYLVFVGIGRYRRARHETLTLLKERVDNADREREQAIQAAQEAERLNIAREMHDVLAHRISLVSMHAGALTYRDDLPRDQIVQAAQVIQDNTSQALSELRGLLGVLRNKDTKTPRAPWPTLDDLPALLADARASGATVMVEFSAIDAISERPVLHELNDTTSRAAYRIVQEALTNARKHAPGQTIHLHIAHHGDQLLIESTNRLPAGDVDPDPTGMGLVGLAERTQLANGTFTAGPSHENFVLKATMPWV